MPSVRLVVKLDLEDESAMTSEATTRSHFNYARVTPESRIGVAVLLSTNG